MTSPIDEIFSEYTRRRSGGTDAKDILALLRERIEQLNREQRRDLADKLRAWEAHPIEPLPSTPAHRPTPIKPIRPLQSLKPKPEAAPAAAWIDCPTCGKANQQTEVFCYACGSVLSPGATNQDTRHFTDPDTSQVSSEFFGPESVLALRPRGGTDVYEIRPQQVAHEVIVGRSATGGAIAPDVDLTAKNGAEMGVSRMHLAIRYDREHKAVLAIDLNSANGTFINGQKLFANEVRVLRHGDELRLGKLVLMVSFRHPA